MPMPKAEMTYALMADNDQQSRPLASLRDTLLARLLNVELPTSNFTQGENKHAK